MKKASIILLFCLFGFLNFSVNAQSNCSVTLDSTPSGISPYGGNYSFNVVAEPNCNWTAEALGNYVTITSGRSGTGNGTVNFTVAENIGNSVRPVRIIVNDKQLSLEQERSCTATPMISPTNVPASPSPGETEIRIQVSISFRAAHCSAFFSADIPWITFVPSGSQSGYFRVENNTGLARTGTISIQTGELSRLTTYTFTINQAAGQSNCTYTLNPTNALFLPGGGGNGTFNVITQPGCAWTAAPNSSWITITSGGSGTGSGTVNFSVGSNFSSSQRFGNIVVNNQTFTISQNRYCNIDAGPPNVSVPSSEYTGSVQVVTSSDTCLFTVASNDSWITITSGERASGIAGFTYKVTANSGAARTGTITIRVSSVEFATITINQASGQQNCTYSINPTSIQAGAAGGDTGFNITTQTGCSWTAASNANWITVLTTSGAGSGRINYSVQPNTGPERVGTITAGGQIFTITQTSGCSYSLSNFTENFPASGGSGSFTLTASNSSCSWSVQASEQWITFTGNTGGLGNATVTFTVAANSGSARSAAVVVANYFVLQINQAARAVDLITASGRVIDQNFKPVRGAVVTFVHAATGERRTARTNSFGYFHFANLERGQQYNATITHKRYKFSGTRGVSYFSSALVVIFTADPE